MDRIVSKKKKNNNNIRKKMEDKSLVSSLSTICREHDFYRSAVDFPYQPVRGPRQFSNELCRPVFYRVADLSGCAPSCVHTCVY